MSHAILRGSTALVCLGLLAAPLPSIAQEADGYLGTLFLTFGKRDIQAGTGTPSTVLGDQEIADRQAGTVAQLIDSVPGVTLINGSTPQGSGINIRGFGANTTFGTDQKVAIQIDGASVGSEEIYRVGTQLYTDPFLFRRVEVLRGTIGSFEYGSGIVGGVVKLETKDASDFTGGVPGFKLAQTIQGSSNGNGLVSSSTLAWQPTERAEFLANYTYRRQGTMKDGTGANINDSAFETPSALVKGRFTFGQDDAHSVALSYSQTTSQDRDVPYDSFQTTSTAFGNVDRDTRTSQASLQYRYNPSGNDLVDLEATLSYADQQIGMTYVPGSSPLERNPRFGAQVRGLGSADHRYQTTKFTLKNTAQFQTGGLNHNLRAGIEAARKERADMLSAPGGTDNRVAVFLIDEMTYGGLTITPALRYETSSVRSSTRFGRFNNDALMGGLALDYTFDNGFSLFASAAYTENLPIIDDLGNSPTSLRRMNTTEKARTFELGAAYASRGVFTGGDNFSIKGNFYQTKLWDVTSYTSGGQDLGKVEQSGFELEASYGLSNGLYFDLNGHYGDGTEFAANGTSTTWRNAPANTTWFTVGKKWGDTVDLSWEVVNSNNNRDSAGASTPDYTLHNLRATYRPQNGALEGTEIRFGVENVMDKTYSRHLASATRNAPGRTFLVSIAAKF